MEVDTDRPLTPSFRWADEYNTILEKIASTDVVETEWPKLRDIIKYKINENVSMYLSESAEVQRSRVPVRPHSPQPTEGGGLKIGPFPPRQRVFGVGPNQTPKAFMSTAEAHELKGLIFVQLHEFDESPPFTIQRVCELCLHPKLHYSSVGKYLRAVERSVLVTTTHDAFPPLSEKDQMPPLQNTVSTSLAGDSAPATPIFSPIPFLHGDARRSSSRSPPPSPFTLNATELATEPVPVADEQKALGLVDELDDPSPGHMSDHPTALTSTTTTPGSPPSGSGSARPFLGSLEQRFVKAEESNSGTEQQQQQQQQAPPSTEETMTLDDNEDKENKG